MGQTHGGGFVVSDENARLPPLEASEHWKQAVQDLYAPLFQNRAITAESKNAMALMMGSTHFASLYVGVYGEMPPRALVEKIPNIMRELVHNETETTRAHLGDDFASLADYAHIIAAPCSEIPSDAAILEHLAQILPQETRTSTTAAISEAAAEGLAQRDSTPAGLAALATFHREIFGRDENARILKATPGQSEWRWADTAMVALVLFTTGHWEDRLWKLYGSRLTDRMRSSLASYWLALPSTHTFVTRDDPVLAVFLLGLVNWPLAASVEE